MNGLTIAKFVAVLVVLAAMMVATASMAFADEVDGGEPGSVGACAKALAQSGQGPEIAARCVGRNVGD